MSLLWMVGLVFLSPCSSSEVLESLQPALFLAGEPEHKRLCRRVIAKFTSRLNWDAISAKALTSTKQENINTSDNYQPFTRLPAANPSSSTPETPSPDPKTARLANFIFAAGDLGRTFDLIKVCLRDCVHMCFWLVYVPEVGKIKSRNSDYKLNQPP